MRGLLKIVGLLLALLIAFVVVVMAASELGGEIVTLHTQSPDGEVTTRLWVVEEAGHAYLRAGQPTSGWLLRINANPEVVVERGGESLRFRAVPVLDDPVLRDRIHELMRQHYGFGDAVVSVIRDGAKSIPVRLDPVVTADAG